MQGMLYQGRFVLRYLHIIAFSFLFSIVFLLLSLFTKMSFIVIFFIFIFITYYFLYLSLPGDLIITDKGLFLKKKFHKIKMIFAIDKMTELNEMIYEYKPSLFSFIFDLFSNFSFMTIYRDPISCVLEITDSNLITYRIYSYQTIHYPEIKNRLEAIVTSNQKYESFN